MGTNPLLCLWDTKDEGLATITIFKGDLPYGISNCCLSNNTFYQADKKLSAGLVAAVSMDD